MGLAGDAVDKARRCSVRAGSLAAVAKLRMAEALSGGQRARSAKKWQPQERQHSAATSGETRDRLPPRARLKGHPQEP
jgi:hypothetical protein